MGSLLHTLRLIWRSTGLCAGATVLYTMVNPESNLSCGTNSQFGFTLHAFITNTAFKLFLNSGSLQYSFWRWLPLPEPGCSTEVHPASVTKRLLIRGHLIVRVFAPLLLGLYQTT